MYQRTRYRISNSLLVPLHTPSARAKVGMNSAPTSQAPTLARSPFTRKWSAAGAGGHRQHHSRSPGGRELAQQRTRRREEQAARVVARLPRAERRPEEDRPDPSEGQSDLLDRGERRRERGDERPDRPRPPEPADPLESQLELGDQDRGEPESHGARRHRR